MNDCEYMASGGVTEEDRTICSLRRATKRPKLARIPFLNRTPTMWRLRPLSSSPTPNSLRPARKVGFSKTVRFKKIVAGSSMTPQEKAELWFTAEERETMRKTARSQALQARIRKPSYEAILNEAFNSALFLAATIDCECLVQDEDVVEKNARCLLKWTCRHNESFRGLENSFSRSHRYSRPELVTDAREMVTMARFRKDFVDENDIAKQYGDMARASVVLAFSPMQTNTRRGGSV